MELEEEKQTKTTRVNFSISYFSCCIYFFSYIFSRCLKIEEASIEGLQQVKLLLLVRALTSVLGHWPSIPFFVWQHFMQLDQLWPQPHPKKSSLQISLMLEIYDNKDLQITPGPVG